MIFKVGFYGLIIGIVIFAIFYTEDIESVVAMLLGIGICTIPAVLLLLLILKSFGVI